jgi:outer membrane protein OmpA-like peptidoglycan-associated protein
MGRSEKEKNEMKNIRTNTVISLAAICLLVLGSAFAVGSGEEFKGKGMITNRAGGTFTMKSGGEPVVVVLDDSTKVQDKVGLFGARKKDFSAAVLIPGLKVDVKGVGDDKGQVLAKQIIFDGDDLEAAEMIEAGVAPTEVKVAENKKNIATNQENIAVNKQGIQTNQQNIATNKEAIDANVKEIEAAHSRFATLDDFDVKNEATLRFPVGKSIISAADKQALKKLAADASSLNGYLIEVKGYADSTGNAVMNQKLSEDRAKNVVAYLIQECNVPVRYVVAPGAMGISRPKSSNETKAGRAENRRVEVKVLVSKGMNRAGQ